MQNKWMKSLSAILLVLTLLLGMTACAGKKSDQESSQTTETTVETTSEPTEETTQPSETTEVPTEEATEETTEETVPETTQAPKPTEAKKPAQEETPKATVPVSDGSQTGQDAHKTDPVPEGQQLPVEPGDMEIDKQETATCYMTITCKTILDNMGDLKDGKDVLVPSDGILLHRTKVTFNPGESVYDILRQVTREKGIPMEANFVPLYNSAYIKGIGNLYEFDCGSGSGWMYCVNGWFPNYGVSRYVPQEGDEIQIIYTCDLGRDIGGGSAVQH